MVNLNTSEYTYAKAYVFLFEPPIANGDKRTSQRQSMPVSICKWTYGPGGRQERLRYPRFPDIAWGINSGLYARGGNDALPEKGRAQGQK
ncbi:hypothetical protein ACRS85_25080 [Pluralibacter gergoviae]|uniref:hypothetical protein n=1 Tax=Pluralibacter gergoviae TaxID=61647 RepID=UPI003EE1CD4B